MSLLNGTNSIMLKKIINIIRQTIHRNCIYIQKENRRQSYINKKKNIPFFSIRQKQKEYVRFAAQGNDAGALFSSHPSTHHNIQPTFFPSLRKPSNTPFQSPL